MARLVQPGGGVGDRHLVDVAKRHLHRAVPGRLELPGADRLQAQRRQLDVDRGQGALVRRLQRRPRRVHGHLLLAARRLLFRDDDGLDRPSQRGESRRRSGGRRRCRTSTGGRARA